jgi:hypothetical protein
MITIDWSKQHCGLRSAPWAVVNNLMPDVMPILKTFPDDAGNFVFDVKVHMLMPRQFPCIPNWHRDNVPRVGGVQQIHECKPELPMYVWISGPPLTQFEHGYIRPQTWHRFTQLDAHRGTPASDFCWRGFIRATHIGIGQKVTKDHLRRHTQVYLDAEGYQW